MLLCITAAKVLAIFIDAHTRIKGIQIGDHKIKIVDFVNDTPTFLRDFSYFTKVIFLKKLYEKTSSSRINFSKITLWGGTYKKELINQYK